MNWNYEKSKQIVDTNGWVIINEFIKHLERITGVTLCDGLKTVYNWDDLTEDETLKLYERLRYEYEKTLKNHKVTVDYEPETISIFAGLCNWIVTAKDKRETNGEIKYYIRQDEFIQFVKSPAGLGHHVGVDEIVNMLNLPDTFKEKRKANQGVNDKKKPRALELTAEEIKIYLFNEVDLIEDGK